MLLGFYTNVLYEREIVPMFDASDYTALLHQLEQFFQDSANQKPVTQNLDPAELRDRYSIELPTHGVPLSELQADIANYLACAVKTAHPMYFNQLWGGFTAPCFIGDVLTSATNTSMYTHEVAPMATLIEKTLVSKMGKLVGFSNPEGQFTTGGSNGNLMALAIARHYAIPTLKQQGMAHAPQLIAFVSADAHYSFAKAVHLLGLGTDQLWPVSVDDQGKMDVAELKRLIQKARSSGARPFFVAATAGTTVRGAYDPFPEIAAIAQDEGLWFHVDGAWGASVLLSRTHRHLMKGAEQADSLVWDAHKMMGMTLTCSVLLVRHRGAMLETFSTYGTDYIFHATDDEPVDLGPSTMHCGRRVDAVKLWLTWKHLGDRGWESLINRYFDLATHAESTIVAHESLELVSPRQALNLCFQYLPKGTRYTANELTLLVRQALLDDGRAMVNYARIGDRVVFRLVICNNQTQQRDIDAFFDVLVAIAQRIDIGPD